MLFWVGGLMLSVSAKISASRQWKYFALEHVLRLGLSASSAVRISFRHRSWRSEVPCLQVTGGEAPEAIVA